MTSMPYSLSDATISFCFSSELMVRVMKVDIGVFLLTQIAFEFVFRIGSVSYFSTPTRPSISGRAPC